MKKIVTIFFLFLLIAGNFGDFIVCSIQQHLAKEAAESLLKKSLPDDALTVINLEKEQNNIRWEEEGEEFSLNGLMYDVARIVTTKTGTLIYCLNDEQEEMVMTKFSKAINENNQTSGDNKTGKHAVKFQMSEFCFDNYEKNSVVISQPSQEFIICHNNLSFIAKEVHAPPPKA